MKPELVKAASEVITNQQILVNMVSRRVRQLSLGHRPLVQCAPGLREADIALTEIANGKLTFESTFGQNGNAAKGDVDFFLLWIACRAAAAATLFDRQAMRLPYNWQRARVFFPLTYSSSS